MRRARNIAFSVAMLFVCCIPTTAQQATQVYRPGAVIQVTITFHGEDASKTSYVGVTLLASGTRKPDQRDFSSQLYSQQTSKTDPSTFIVSLPIPTNQATGDYEINQIQAFVGDPKITIVYSAPNDFTTKTYRIENPGSFKAPQIESVR